MSLRDDNVKDRQLKLGSISEKTLERLSALEIDLAAIKSNYATKKDITRMEVTLLKWYIATAVALAGIAFGVARVIH